MDMERTTQFLQSAVYALEQSHAAPDLVTRETWLNIGAEWAALAQMRIELMGASPPAYGFEPMEGKPN